MPSSLEKSEYEVEVNRSAEDLEKTIVEPANAIVERKLMYAS
jgi:hypothetical protein